MCEGIFKSGREVDLISEAMACESGDPALPRLCQPGQVASSGPRGK